MLFLSFIPSLLKIFDTESLIRGGGLLLVFLFVFGQTGLFFCFFLPSGGLMFTAGVLAAAGTLKYNVAFICMLLAVAAVLGNITGYWLGKNSGSVLYKRKDSKFFKREYLDAAANFYNKHGGLATAAALFFPITRSFAPLVAGIARMNFIRFVFFALVGSVLWVTSFVMAGYLLASIPMLRKYIPYTVVLVIVIVTIPVITTIIRKLKKQGNEKTF
jgi:membrane-associated protein